MNNKVLYLTTGFVVGAVAGSAAAWYFLKDKYKKIADDEIESVKKTIKKKHTDKSKDEDRMIKSNVEKPNIMEYASTLKEHGYVDYARNDMPKDDAVEPDEHEDPVYISPADFGERDDYDQVSYTYYADGILADDADEPVVEIADCVGDDFDKHFGEYEDDSVYVRNDYNKCYYEILRSLQTYDEVSKTKPKDVEIK